MNKATIGICFSAFLCAASFAVAQTGTHADGSVTMNITPMTPQQIARGKESGQLAQDAKAALDAGKYAEAESVAKKSMAIQFGSGLAQEILALAYFQSGDDKDALQVYTRIVVNERGRQPGQLLPYALLELKAGHWAEAVDAYTQALPSVGDIPLQKGTELLSAHNNFVPGTPAPAQLEAAIHMALGLEYGSGAMWAPRSPRTFAMKEFNAALALEPDSALANLCYAAGLRQMHQPKNVVQGAFERAEELSKADADADVRAAADRGLNGR